jgi:hypothetical protein
MQIIETPRLVIKPFTPELVFMPGSVRELPFEQVGSLTSDPVFEASYRENPSMEMDFAESFPPKGGVILWELVFVLNSIAAGSIIKSDYEAALAYIDKACADNSGGKASRMAVIAKKEQEEKTESLAALINLFNADTDCPLLEIMPGTRIPRLEETGYLGEAYRAFMQWARKKYGFSRVRLFDKYKGRPSVPPDTVSVYNPKEPDSEMKRNVRYIKYRRNKIG